MNTQTHAHVTTNTTPTPAEPKDGPKSQPQGATPEELLLTLGQIVLEGHGAWFDALSPEELAQGQAVIDRARALIVAAAAEDNDLVWDWLWEAAIDLEQAAEEANMIDLAEALEDIPEVEPPAVVTRVDALVALGRTVLEKREDQLTPHEIHRGWALLHKANELLEELGSPGSCLDDFLYTAAYEWIEQEATERLRELWELPKTELFNISERRYHLRELLMSFYEEAYGKPEEAIYLLREFIGR